MADIQGIYNRLNSGSQYTPLSAETFGDWSMEAGDLVTVVKDGRSYLTPIMQGDLKWDGASKVTIESVGNREREPLGRMSRRKYSGGGGGYWNSRKAFTKIAQSDTEINLIAKEQKNIGGKVTTLESNFSVMSDRIGGAISENGKIIASAAIEAITGPDGKTLLGVFRVKADKIIMDGETTINDIMTVTGSATLLKGVVVIGDKIDTGVFIGSDHVVSAPGFKIRTGILAGRTLNVVDVQPQGTNALRVTYADGTTWDFSKATSLDGAWSSTYGPFRVQASPQGETMDIKVEFVAKGPSGFPIVRPAKTGANLFVIDLDVGSITGSGVNGKRTVSAKAGDNVAESAVLTDYGDGYRDGRNASTITPTAINVYTAQQGTLLSTKLSASILTAGKYITMKVGSTTYSIQIT